MVAKFPVQASVTAAASASALCNCSLVSANCASNCLTSGRSASGPFTLETLVILLQVINPLLKRLHLAVVSSPVDGEGDAEDGGDSGQDAEQGAIILEQFDKRIHGPGFSRQ